MVERQQVVRTPSRASRSKDFVAFGRENVNDEVLEACSDATYSVYQAYLFLLVNEAQFQTMTSIIQGSVSTALFISSELGQILVLVGTPLNQMMDITIASGVIRCILAFMLPNKQIEIEDRPQFALDFFSKSQTVWVAYALYIIMFGLEKLLLCFVYAHCGSLVKNDRYALMFSFNCGLSYAVQVVVQALLEITGVDIVGLYRAFGYYFLGIAFGFSALYGMYVWKAKRLELISLEDDTPKELIKEDPFHEPLIDNGVLFIQDNS
ncbi:hypothetical protein L7F22_029822 [Adiantum nelumboides]|nr:hypothetical protein [Adiantum nelumboides]